VTDEPRQDGGASDPGRGASEAPTDTLRQLEERLDRAARAAERLIAQARAEATSAGMGPEPPTAGAASASEGPAGAADEHRPPLAGWQAPESGSDDGRELELLAQLMRSLRDLLPPDLQRRLAEAVRELLLALRALIDFYLERLERRSAPPTEVEDIPIS
jgi:hypothetical protein